MKAAQHPRDRQFDHNQMLSAQDGDCPWPLAALQNGAKVKVSKRVAQEWIMFQQTVTYQGTVYWLQIRPLGLGLFEVYRRERNNKETVLVKEFEAV